MELCSNIKGAACLTTPSNFTNNWITTQQPSKAVVPQAFPPKIRGLRTKAARLTQVTSSRLTMLMPVGITYKAYYRCSIRHHTTRQHLGVKVTLIVGLISRELFKETSLAECSLFRMLVRPHSW